MPQRRRKAPSKQRSRPAQQTIDRLRLALKREREERKEAVERQTATGEILKVIAGSPSDVQPVFETICKSAAQLCNAKDAVLWYVDGDTMRVGGHFGDLPVEEVPVASSAPGRTRCRMCGHRSWSDFSGG